MQIHSTRHPIWLPTLLLVFCALPARAEVHSTAHTVSMPLVGKAIVNVDLDENTNTVSAWVYYGDLINPVTTVSLEGSVTTLLDLAHTGGVVGFASGTAQVTPSEFQSIIGGQAQLVIASSVQPSGELSIPVTFGPTSTETSLTPQQVVAGSNSEGLGSVFTSFDLDGSAEVIGAIAGLSSAVTSLEVRGPALAGAVGPLITTGVATPSGSGSVAYSVNWNAADAQALDFLEDGLAYLLVRTTDFPDGELRAQLAPSWIGRSYCPSGPDLNSAGPALLLVMGSVDAANNSLTVNGSFLPVNKPVLPLVGFNTGHLFNLPATAGFLCLGGGPIVRMTANLGTVSSVGTFRSSLDLNTLPGGAPNPGDELNFQLWYRDTDPQGAATTKFSDAVSVRFY